MKDKIWESMQLKPNCNNPQRLENWLTYKIYYTFHIIIEIFKIISSKFHVAFCTYVQYCNGRQYNEWIQVLYLYLVSILVFLIYLPMESNNTKLHVYLYCIEYNDDVVSHFGYVYPYASKMSFATSSSSISSSERIIYMIFIFLRKENFYIWLSCLLLKGLLTTHALLN